MICDITLFNRYTFEHEYAYQRTYLYKVDWGEPKHSFGVPDKFSTLIQIPVLETLKYRLPREWKKEKEGFWTLQLEDVIVQGIIPVQLNTIVTDIYDLYDLYDLTILYTLTNLKKNYEVVTVTDIQTKGDTISQQTINIGCN